MNNDNQPQTREEWYAVIEVQKKSNLTQNEFCKHNGLILCRFTYYAQLYRKQYKNKTPVDTPSFSPVIVNQSINSMSNEIKIDLPNGFRCQVTSHIPTEQLKKIIGVLLSC